jgi:uroporphyrin-3 C-methyltransferase
MNQKSDDNDAEPVTAEKSPALITANGAADRGKEEAGQAARPRRRIASVIAWFALLLALLSVAGTGYLYWRSGAEGARAARSQESLAAVSGNVQEALDSLENLKGSMSELATSDSQYEDEISALERQLGEILDRFETLPGRLRALESAVSSLQGISTDARDTWLLAEAEYYMQIANAQLQLAGNPARARMALEFADQRIQQLANPALTDVRRALSRELRELDAIEKPDIEGMSMTLASLADEVSSLPLRQNTATKEAKGAPPATEQSGFDRALSSVKNAFSGIVSVRRTDEDIRPLLSPDAQYFLRANLALQLQTARLALLRGEQAIFEQSLADASSWLNEYYAADSRAVQSALETLAGLRGGGFAVAMPDISESLELLREFRTRRAAEQAVPVPADPGTAQ